MSRWEMKAIALCLGITKIYVKVLPHTLWEISLNEKEDN